MAKRVVCLRTHFWDAGVEATFVKMRQDLGADSVYAVVDVTRISLDGLFDQHPLLVRLGVRYSPGLKLSREDTQRIVLITEDDCAALNPMHLYGKVPEVGSKYRGETHVVAMARALGMCSPTQDSLPESVKSYHPEYLYLIEYDVLCNGSWRVVLDACDSITSDYMAKGSDTSPEIRTGQKDPHWCWWNDRYGPDMQSLSVSDLHGCFYPLSRYSRAFLRELSADLGRNSGFCEVYIPTLCVMRGLTYKGMPHSVLGTFRFFNPMPPSTFEGMAPDDRLYHPVKSC